MSKMLRPHEVAELLDVPTETVRGWCRSGKLAAIDVSRVAGRGKPRYRISRESLERFMEAGRVSPPQPAKAKPKRSARRRYVSRDGDWLV